MFSQAIVNKSRAKWRAMVSKIPVQIDDFDKIPQISEEIKNMMIANANVFLEEEQPYCYLSRVERSFAELSLGCNLKQMVCVFSQTLKAGSTNNNIRTVELKLLLL